MMNLSARISDMKARKVICFEPSSFAWQVANRPTIIISN